MMAAFRRLTCLQVAVIPRYVGERCAVGKTARVGVDMLLTQLLELVQTLVFPVVLLLVYVVFPIARISYLRAPTGTGTVTASPTRLPNIAWPTGDSFESLALVGSASAEPTSV